MTVYASSNAIRNGNTGTIAIRMGDAIADVTIDYEVDVVVSIENGNYNYTASGADFTFGNNGARWRKFKFSSGQVKNLVYNWSTAQSNATTYVVVLSGTASVPRSLEKTKVLHVHFGSIPGTQSLLANTSPYEDLEFLVSLKEQLKKLKAPPPNPPIG